MRSIHRMPISNVEINCKATDNGGSSASPESRAEMSTRDVKLTAFSPWHLYSSVTLIARRRN